MASNPERGHPALSKSLEERTIIDPAERREAVVQVIRSAQDRLILSLFRCDDLQVLDELAAVQRRNVRVEVLLTSRAKGGKKHLRKLGAFLESMGAEVHRYSDPVVKYHAKYVVADDGPALVTSLNFTRKCLERTCDFVHITRDAGVVSGLKRLFEADCRATESILPQGVSDRLIVGPQKARAQLAALLQQARQSIRIIDHKLTDPLMLALLLDKQAEGVVVEVLSGSKIGNLLSHGKVILVDGTVAAIGSISLSALSLGFRREVAILVHDLNCVRRLDEFFSQSVVAGLRSHESPDEEPSEEEEENQTG